MSAKRKLVLRSLVVVVAAVGAVGLWAAGESVSAAKAGVLWQLGLGLFTALLTAQTIVFAVSADPETVWPSFLDLVEETGLVLWLTTGTFSVLLPAAADITGRGGLLADLSLGLVVAQLILGIDSLQALLRVLAGEGRQLFLARLASEDLRRAARSGRPVRVDRAHALAGYLGAVETAIDSADVAALGQRMTEVARQARDDEHAEVARWRLALLTYLIERVGRAVLYHDLTGDAARVALPHLIDGALHSSYRLTELTGTGAASEDHVSEVEAAVTLGQVCRVIGWLQQAAHERLQERPDDVSARQVISSVAKGRLRIVQFVDPDPPGFYRQAEDPWPYGLSDPAAVLVWLWSMCEFGGSWVGSGLYVLAEVITGEKFYGNYWNDECIFTEIERRIGADGSRRHRTEDGRAAEVVAACGGLQTVALELCATVIAGLRNTRFTPPAGFEQDPTFSTDRRYLRSQITMFATYDCLPDPDGALNWLSTALSQFPTQRSLWRTVDTAVSAVGHPGTLDLHGPDARPAATTLAALCCLQMHRPDDAREFVDRLPEPLVAGALQLARFSLTIDGPAEPVMLTWSPRMADRLGDRPARRQELLDIIEAILR
ncbi:hypothetical protein FrEUN1fDRAFT_1870 [Parafrankia sp. EUN1f]|nr:hypothetical protein FrEUN1fDRAFT_1870 [Parafrankia sp. EUN1f]